MHAWIRVVVVLCSRLSRAQSKPQRGFRSLLAALCPYRCLAPLQTWCAWASPSYSLRALRSRQGCRLGFFVPFAAESWLFILSVVFHRKLMWSLLWFLLQCLVHQTHRARCGLQGCCGIAVISESLFSFSLSPSFIAEINKSRAALCDVCASCCSCFPYVDTYLFSVGKNKRNPVIWPSQTPSVGAVYSGWPIASF